MEIMPTPDTKMKQRIRDLQDTIKGAGKKGCNLIALINRVGVEHGIQTKTVKSYIQMLQNGGYIIEKHNRVYDISMYEGNS